MDSINSIIDFNKHPINDFNYIQKCNSLIKKNSLLVLENFLLDKSLKNILNEAKQLEDKAYYCEQQHTILLTKLSDTCLLYTSPSPRDGLLSRMPSSA